MPPGKPIDPIDHHLPEFELGIVDDLDGETVHIQVSGDIDMVTLAHLDDTLGSLGEEGDRRHVVVDVGDVTFLSACGVSRLVAAQHRLGVRGQSLALHRASTHQQRLLRIGGFDCARNVPVDATATASRPGTGRPCS
jgi:anti-anti-sigma factor